ncbi:MAG TPA: acetyl-CoA carboxylase biotin carboxylase subunit [Gemmatimonadota bacterium]|nr:acetyl-CoA carboxylase biotin carboxylase subunit [Gemmatimonadota bacterium]
MKSKRGKRMRTSPRSVGGSLRRVLVANRGEIAVRVIRACRSLGIEAAAVFSDADRDAPHVALADLAAGIGPAPPRDSYLSIERLLEAGRRLDVDAVHPGYGFLAENAAFAEAVREAGWTWVGPPPAAIRAMGEKTEARRAMQAAGVPVVPGTAEPLAGLDEARARAAEAGYPILLKAAAGGGGRGMRRVEDEAGLEGALRAARNEAGNAFGDPAVYLEKFVPEARHVEIQVFADREGRTIHLGERECSVQRRHQKVLEEAPAPGLDAGTRTRMGREAVRAARAVAYEGAGTVEFLLAPDGEFWFLEMNTRIQVEHPVTEMVTGIDLVALQLRVAAGEPLPLTQEELDLRGHAVECRITAEDPAAGFRPATGTVTEFRAPGGPGVRFDAGIETGTEITPHYDPLLAKCVTWGRTRDEALDRMRTALAETTIGGVTTNLPLQRILVEHPELRAARVHTRWLERGLEEILARLAEARRPEEPLAAALAAWASHTGRRTAQPLPPSAGLSAWRRERWVWIR